MILTGWYLIPWTLQYLVGFVIALLVSVYIFRKYPNSRAYQYFLLFGLSISFWAILTFLHRNAPSQTVSSDIFRGVMFLSDAVQSLILLVILYIEKKKPYFSLLVVPLLAIGFAIAILAPYDLIWTDYGWSYSMRSPWLAIVSASSMIYLAATVVLLAVKIKNSLVHVLRKKYAIFLIGYGVIYGAGMAFTNIQISSNPAFPPFGGILLTTVFLIVAYGMTQSAEKIELQESREEVDEPK